MHLLIAHDAVQLAKFGAGRNRHFPVALQQHPAGRQQRRQFRAGRRRHDAEAGRARLRLPAGEPVRIEAGLGRAVRRGTGPLNAPFLAGGVQQLRGARRIYARLHHQRRFPRQAVVAHAPVVGVDAGNFVQYRRRVVVADAVNPQPLRQLRQYPALGAGCAVPHRHRRAHPLDAPFQVGKGAVLFGKSGARQYHIGHLPRWRKESVHYRQKVQPFQGGNPVIQRSVDQVGAVADEQHRPDVPPGGGQHPCDTSAAGYWQFPAPRLLNPGLLLVVKGGMTARQASVGAAHIGGALGVGALPQGENAPGGVAHIAGQQCQVSQGGGAVLPDGGRNIVHPIDHSPAAGGGGEHSRGGGDVLRGHAGGGDGGIAQLPQLVGQGVVAFHIVGQPFVRRQTFL